MEDSPSQKSNERAAGAVPISGSDGRPGKLYAIADLHLSYLKNCEEWRKLKAHRDDGLVICGDVGETREHLDLAFSIAKDRFKDVWWTPGNHELYTPPTESDSGARGEAKYRECVEVARSHGVVTPEEPFMVWEGEDGPCLIAPIFTLYDYSFKPDHVSLDKAVDWAREDDIEATDEYLLHPDPYPSRGEWCNALVEAFKKKLEDARAAHPDLPLIIAGHWPLRGDLVYLRYIPRFRIWCGTTKTDDWHKTFKAKVVISGHLHVRRTDWKDGTRFEECSFGYPRQRTDCIDPGINSFLVEILPGPDPPAGGNAPTAWRHCKRLSPGARALMAQQERVR